MSLTESFAMLPTAAVSRFLFRASGRALLRGRAHRRRPADGFRAARGHLARIRRTTARPQSRMTSDMRRHGMARVLAIAALALAALLGAGGCTERPPEGNTRIIGTMFFAGKLRPGESASEFRHCAEPVLPRREGPRPQPAVRGARRRGTRVGGGARRGQAAGALGQRRGAVLARSDEYEDERGRCGDGREFAQHAQARGRLDGRRHHADDRRESEGPPVGRRPGRARAARFAAACGRGVPLRDGDRQRRRRAVPADARAAPEPAPALRRGDVRDRGRSRANWRRSCARRTGRGTSVTATKPAGWPSILLLGAFVLWRLRAG